MKKNLKTVILAIFFSAATYPAASIIIPEGADPDVYVISERAFPAVFPISRTPRGYKECGATLITENWAVTAGHCVFPILRALENNRPYVVEINGASNEVDLAIQHPKGPKDGMMTEDTVDLALIHLKNPIQGVDPMPLYNATDEAGQEIFFVGWGDLGTADKGPYTNDIKFRMATNRITEAQGNALFFVFDKPGSKEAVSMEGVGGPGDSGVPAFIERDGKVYIIGISSGQFPPEGGPDRPGAYGATEVFMRMSTLQSWIWETIQAASR